MEIGDFGIIVAKDFGSILSMNRDGQAQTLAALREVYDGSWTRLVGTDGGRALHWQGKVGFVGGVTPTIDRHHAVMGAMGERFMLFRLPTVDADTQARSALSHAGKERQMRKELADAVAGILASQTTTAVELDDDEVDQLVALGTLVVRARSAVERDNYTREIELVPGSEAPTRYTIMLKRLLTGMYAIGMDKQSAWRVLTKVGLDSIPALRFAIMDTLADYGQKLSTNDLAGAVRHPATTTRRACEDLVAHGLLEMTRQGDGKAHLWDLSEFTTNRLRTVQETLPDRPVEARKTVSAEGVERVPFNASGISGKVESRTTEPNTEGFPGMSVSPETVPEIPEGVSSKPLPNQIPNIPGTLVNGTDRNNHEEAEQPPPDDSLQPYDLEPANGRVDWTDL